MNKPEQKYMSIDKLMVNKNLNVREADNYDPTALEGQIVNAGRILKTIVAEKVTATTLSALSVGGLKLSIGDVVVLQGHRRADVGQSLLARKDISAELAENLGKVHVMIYTDLTEAERLEIIVDHGSEKPINRTELVKVVWRMAKEFADEMTIITLLYYAFARYTGNDKKVSEVQAIKEPGKRKEVLRKWLHGTVGNYILTALKLGQFVRDQFILTHRSEDRTLKEGETVSMKCSRERVQKLYSARIADEKAAGWTPDQGGVTFNALIETYVAEDKGESEKEKIKRPSSKELKDRADVFKSSVVRKALLLAAGVTGPEVEGLVNDDERYFRADAIVNLISAHASNLPDNLREFAKMVTTASPLDFELYVKALQPKTAEGNKRREPVSA